jgi:hypothetical protein
MEIRVMTPLNQSVNDEIGLFKYERGRYLALGVALVLLGGGVGLLFLKGLGLIIGVILIGISFFFVLGFTLLWAKTRQSIIVEERKRHPFTSGANLLAVFSEDKVLFTLEKAGSPAIDEEHAYSDFRWADVTEHYVYFAIGDPKKNPAIPVKMSEELLSFLKTKSLKLVYHKGSVALR